MSITNASAFIYSQYGLKLALRGKIADLLQQPVSFMNGESLYQTDREQARLGPRPIVSANFGNLTTLRSIEDLILLIIKEDVSFK